METTTRSESLRSSTILLVDDEPRILDALAGAIRRTMPTVRVIYALDEPRAIDLIDREPVDVVVADHVLQRGDGVHVLAHAFEAQPAAARFMMTGYSTSEIEGRARVEGHAHGIIHKPASLLQVCDQIRETLHVRDARLEGPANPLEMGFLPAPQAPRREVAA